MHNKVCVLFIILSNDLSRQNNRFAKMASILLYVYVIIPETWKYFYENLIV